MTQAQALKIMKTGVNVYLSGSAGSGKTYVLNQYIAYLREHDIPVAITASTGIAATHMGGITIHGWAGIGIRDELTDYDLEMMEEKQYLHKRFEKARVLIIDEVSMLHAHRLDMVNRVCKHFRRSEKPFGGLQVILSGDFFQLPPITRRTENEDPDHSDIITRSLSWAEMQPAICYLTEQHRQEDDDFTQILNAIRSGNQESFTYEKLHERMHAELSPEIRPTKLYTHNVDVDGINAGELAGLGGQTYTFLMEGTGSPMLLEGLKKSCLAHDVLQLKVGAEVMFIKNNFEYGYVNGTRGRVVSFRDQTPVVKLYNGKEIDVFEETWAIEENGKIKASITQLPLRHAWAITIHKSQGMSLDAAEIDLSKSFTYGMGYVALSRVRTLSGVRLIGINEQALAVDPNVLALDETLQIQSDDNDELFGKLTDAEQKQLEEDFITRCGGSIEPISPEEREEKEKKIPTIIETKLLLDEKLSLEDIATKRKLTLGTIVSHIEDLREKGHDVSVAHIVVDPDVLELVKKHFQTSEGKLTPLKRALEREGCDVPFEMIRIARLFIN